MSLIVLDASLWVSRLVSQGVFHEKVKSWMESQQEIMVDFVSPSLLLAEVAGAISRRTNSSDLGRRALDTLVSLPRLRLVEMDSDLMRLAAQLAGDLGLRGADSTYAAVALHLDLPLATLDEDQKKRASQMVSIVEIPAI